MGLYGSVVPPPRVNSIFVIVISPPVTALYQTCVSDGTHGVAPIDGVVGPGARVRPRQHKLKNQRGPTGAGLSPHKALRIEMLFSAMVSRANHFLIPYVSLLVVRVSRR